MTEISDRKADFSPMALDCCTHFQCQSENLFQDWALHTILYVQARLLNFEVSSVNLLVGGLAFVAYFDEILLLENHFQYESIIWKMSYGSK